MTRIMLTAGFDRSLYSISVAETLRQAGTAPGLILIGYPLSVARFRDIVRTRGLAAIARYAIGGKAGQSAHGQSPLRNYADTLGDVGTSLRSWAKRHGVECVTVADLNGDETIKRIESYSPSVTVYTGGGILRRGFIEAAKRRVLNAHSGPLPQVRGMNACEWSLLLAQPLSSTIHLIDEGIDTGLQLERIGVEPRPGDSLECLRERCVVAGAKGIARWALQDMEVSRLLTAQASASGTIPSRQCFVMAPVLREIVEQRLPALIEQQTELKAQQ